jgi:hypothetical protein
VFGRNGKVPFPVHLKGGFARMAYEQEYVCPVCGTASAEERCPNPHCPAYGYCPTCRSPLGPDGTCSNGHCTTNRPTLPPKHSSFISRQPRRQSFRDLMRFPKRFPRFGLYKRILHPGALSKQSAPDSGFDRDEPPTLQERPCVTQSGVRPAMPPRTREEKKRAK